MDEVDACEECDKICCKSCRMRMYQEGDIDCFNCIKYYLPDEVLLQLMVKSRNLQQKVEELKNGGVDFDSIRSLPNEVIQLFMEQSSTLKQEVEDLKNEVSELKIENKELHDEVKELKDDKQGKSIMEE